VKFCRRHANARSTLEAWFKEAQEATWATPEAIKDRYASADFLADNRVIFNIKGNHYYAVALHFAFVGDGLRAVPQAVRNATEGVPYHKIM